MASRTTNKALPKAARTDSRLTYDIAFCTWRSRPVLIAEMHGLIADCLAALEDAEGLSILYRSMTPSSVTLRVQAPATASPNGIVSKIKRALHRSITAAYPDLRSRIPTIFTRASWIRTVGHTAADGASVFLAKERGDRSHV
jgi:putative transposase